MELVVPDEKLSLAIGRKGQNVRLAAQLTQWKLDILGETKFKQLEEESLTLLQRMIGVNEASAKAMYRSGFRAPEEVAEASVEELAAIAGVGADGAEKLKNEAESTVERIRQERIQAAISRTEPLSDHDRMLLIKGVGDRTVTLLEEAGYRSVEEILREDEDRLAGKTGFGQKKARLIKTSAKEFAQSEQKLLAKET